MNKLYILFVLFTFGYQITVFAQPSNTDCEGRITITNPRDWCSAVGEYTNVNAGPSPYTSATCWGGSENDVWFQFTAVARSISITVIGQASGGGTLNNPEVALYEANNCVGAISERDCGSDNTGNDIVSIIKGALIIGQTYYIRVDGVNGSQGTFELCLINFNPPVEPGQDCITAAILCDKSTFVVESVTGAGLDNNEAPGTCLDVFGPSESQSTWFKWTCKDAGTLTFVLDPIRKTTEGGSPNAGDDLDFALFELVEGIDMCGVKATRRCSATHPFTYDFGNNATVVCNYQTGLDMTSTDINEDSGCDNGEDGFVQFIDMQAGESYALLINNFSETGQGFEISFGGTGTFLGPEPDFIIDPLEGLRCDTSFTITDISTFDNGNIIDWDWNFGKDALPAGASTIGPHTVNYESFGQKSVALTVTSDRGCLITKVIDIDVLACCSDTSTLMAFAEATKLICPGDQNGELEATQTGGAGPYMYSVNGGGFVPTNTFGGLTEGVYEVQVQDKKGCLDTTMVDIFPPNPITLDAGPDVTVELGEETELDANYTPSFGNEIIEWIANEGLDCTDCLDPTAIAPGTYEYIIQVTDDNGCSYLDTVVVRTNIDIDRPVFSPNIMLVDDPNEGFFMIGTSRAADFVLDLTIFDRWGNLIWEGHDIATNDFRAGWDGYFGGMPAQYGVYTWAATVHYIDDKVFQYSGDIMLVK